MSIFYSTFAIQLKTNTTMAKKVYTLLRTSATRGENAEDVRVFGSLEKAKKTMQEEYLAELNDWKSWCGLEDMSIDVSETSRCIYERGAYSYNHIDWKVEEKEVL